MHGKHRRLATFIMSDNSLKFEKVMDRVFKHGEPEWRGRNPPRFIRHPTTEEDRTHNCRQYLIGFPWVDAAKDHGREMRYHCGICRKVATISYILSDHHIEKTSTHFSKALGYSILRWMERFKGFITKADPTEHLFDEDEYDLWPEVCTECNINLSDACEHGCHFCRPSATQASTSATAGGKDYSVGNADRRFLAADGRTAEERGRTSRATFTVEPSPYQDYRMKHDGGSSQSGRARNRDGQQKIDMELTAARDTPITEWIPSSR